MDSTSQTSRRGFLLLGVAAFISGCEPLTPTPKPKPKTRYKNRQQDKTGKNAKNKDKKNNRKYPCGLPKNSKPETWEYTVVTARRYLVRVNGVYVSRPKIFILCGKDEARKWKKDHPKDSVTRTG